MPGNASGPQVLRARESCVHRFFTTILLVVLSVAVVLCEPSKIRLTYSFADSNFKVVKRFLVQLKY